MVLNLNCEIQFFFFRSLKQVPKSSKLDDINLSNLNEKVYIASNKMQRNFDNKADHEENEKNEKDNTELPTINERLGIHILITSILC